MQSIGAKSLQNHYEPFQNCCTLFLHLQQWFVAFILGHTIESGQALLLPLGASSGLLIMFFLFDQLQLLFTLMTAGKSLPYLHSFKLQIVEGPLLLSDRRGRGCFNSNDWQVDTSFMWKTQELPKWNALIADSPHQVVWFQSFIFSFGNSSIFVHASTSLSISDVTLLQPKLKVSIWCHLQQLFKMIAVFY